MASAGPPTGRSVRTVCGRSSSDRYVAVVLLPAAVTRVASSCQLGEGVLDCGWQAAQPPTAVREPSPGNALLCCSLAVLLVLLVLLCCCVAVLLGWLCCWVGCVVIVLFALFVLLVLLVLAVLLCCWALPDSVLV